MSIYERWQNRGHSCGERDPEWAALRGFGGEFCETNDDARYIWDSLDDQGRLALFNALINVFERREEPLPFRH